MSTRDELDKIAHKAEEVAHKQGNDPSKWDQNSFVRASDFPISGETPDKPVVMPDMENPKFVQKRDPKAREEAMDELRRSVTKKIDRWADKLIISMYTPPNIPRVEGETWKEDGKTWTKKGGIKMTVSANQDARMPWWCPKCSRPMNGQHDRKFYYRKGMCMECTIDWEGLMRRNGTYAAYERRCVRENEKSWLREQIEEQSAKIKEFHYGKTVFHDGRTADIVDQAAFKPLFEAVEKDIELLIRRLEAIAREEQEESDANAQEHPNVDMDQRTE